MIASRFGSSRSHSHASSGHGRRGLTLVELMAALVMLGGLAAVIVPWVQTAAQLHTDEAPTQAWSVQADRLLDLIADDLNTGDSVVTEARQRSNRESSPRISIDQSSSALHIRTRAPRIGEVERIYEFDEWNDVMRCRSGSGSSARIVLNDVADWRCSLEQIFVRSVDDPQQEEGPWILIARVSSIFGIERRREYLIHP